MSLRSVLAGPATADGSASASALVTFIRRWLQPAAIALVVAGLVCWLLDIGLVAMWLFTIAAVLWALVLPLPYAFVSPLFMGVVAWLVDMLPFVVLAGWATAVARWGWTLFRERRLPRGGRWIWVPIFLVAWTCVGVTALDITYIKHFTLLVGIQVLISGTVLAMVDQFADVERRARVVTGLVLFIIVLMAGVFLEWVGVPIQELQDSSVSARAEEAYGVDAFPNDTGMIKYSRAAQAGSYELRRDLIALEEASPDLPTNEVYRAPHGGFEGGKLLVKFRGTARPYEDDLNAIGITLLYDNVGIADAVTIPRLRSFPRNALTFAGMGAAIFPMAFFLAWSPDRRRRLLGRIGIAACLFGAGFSIARGAWAAILVGCVYFVLDGVAPGKRKLQFVGAFVAGAVVLTAVFLIKYGDDPLTARAGGEGSVKTRQALYIDTVESFGPRHLVTGFGTTLSRQTDAAAYGKLNQYVPPAGTHSTYLNYMFRTGLPGLIALVALYALSVLHARIAARTSEGERRTFAGLAATSVVIAGAHALVLSLYVEPVYTLVISLLIGLAMAGAQSLPRSILPWRKQSSPANA
ncbi:MAG: O-antigen ligase family protein [Actinomycetota bacterium]|nr:O-antigen ligase family protein [Actinomycetota bacterium]